MTVAPPRRLCLLAVQATPQPLTALLLTVVVWRFVALPVEVYVRPGQQLRHSRCTENSADIYAEFA